jgi:hypothetical protein
MNDSKDVAMNGMKQIAGAGFLLLLSAIAMAQATRADAFSDNFHASCVQSGIAAVEKKGVVADANVQAMVNHYCDCAFTQMQSHLTVPEQQQLMSANPDPALIERIRPLAAQCYKENMKQ